MSLNYMRSGLSVLPKMAGEGLLVVTKGVRTAQAPLLLACMRHNKYNNLRKYLRRC